MTLALGTVPAGTTLYIPFATYAGATGASVTLTGLAVTDIEIYKNGSTTQRASDNGFALLDTDGIDFDGITGIHGFSIDLSDNTTSGFYSVGAWYWVVVSAVTVDGQTVNFVAATFRIGPAEITLGVPVVNTTGAVHSGTAQGGATASITLAASASATNGTYDPGMVRITGGTGAGQARLIIDYVGSTRVASVNRDWRVNPDSTSTYEVLAATNLTSTNEGLATSGGANTIGLNSSASSVNNVYRGQTVVLVTGTGQDQSRVCSAYNGTTKVVTVSTPWEVQPVAGTGYIMNPLGRARVAAMEDDVISAAAIASDAGTEIGTAVWASATRVLTAGTNIALAKGTGVTGFNDLSAAQVNAEADQAIADAALATAANLATVAGYLDTEIAAILAKVINLPASPAATGDIPSAASVVAALHAAVVAEGYAADGDEFTFAQALYMIWSLLHDRSISGTTLTSGKLDKSAAMTFTLDSATTPTAQERAT
jgi:hypothetical protein